MYKRQPLVVCVNQKVAGVIELQDIIKPGIEERFERLRKMGDVYKRQGAYKKYQIIVLRKLGL